MKFNLTKANISTLIGILLVVTIISSNLLFCLSINGDKVVFQGIKTSQSIQSTNGIPIGKTNDDETNPLICIDGYGGAFITWAKYNGAVDFSGQCVDPNGNEQWVENGIDLDLGIPRYPKLISDGLGGFILVWDHYVIGEPEIYGMRFNSSGSKLWPGFGVDISSVNEGLGGVVDPHKKQVCGDSSGGVIVTWKDSRGGLLYHIYTQRVNSTGDVQWTTDGVHICVGGTLPDDITSCSDGEGGAIIGWYDQRSDDGNIYAQRINSTGDVQWTTNGKDVCSYIRMQHSTQMCSDGNKGAIIAWHDYRHTSIESIYAQRINSTGDKQWAEFGIEICKSESYIDDIKIINDDSEGAIITWRDNRYGSGDIFAQRVNSSGDLLWTTNGSAICTAAENQRLPQICSDGAGGAIITWQDESTDDGDIYAQRINSSGDLQWATNGIPICRAFYRQEEPSICSDDQGGAIITWQDIRSETDNDVYAQRVTSNGTALWSIENDIPTSNHPDDMFLIGNSSAIINWTLTDDDGFGNYRVFENNNGGTPIILTDWTGWYNNTPIVAPIDSSIAGIYNYTIEYYDNEYTNGLPDSVIVTINATSDGNGNGNGGEPAIPFGNFYLPFGFFTIISIIIVKKRRILSKSK